MSSAKMQLPDSLRLATKVRPGRTGGFLPADRINSILTWSANDYYTGRYKTRLYRFLTDNIPVINASVSTWVRLSAAPGSFRIEESTGDHALSEAKMRLDHLAQRFYLSPSGQEGSLVTFLTELFNNLYRDGLFGGFLTVTGDGSAVDKFIPIDGSDIVREKAGANPRLVLQSGEKKIDLDRPDFYYLPFNSDIDHPLGRSILQAVPFVAYIERQLTDDMRRASHNSGFHRLHVKVTPPERSGGESDQAYMDRINSYFDSTVGMIKSCDVDENPVTWDNVSIEYIGPENVRSVSNSWFVNHRAVIEEVCAGTNLSPFLLGYSYGATGSWASFKFDIVMRQVKSVQSEVASLLEWIGNIDLALAGIKARCRFVFDNSFAYQATDQVKVDTGRLDNILRLLEDGLIDQETARRKAGELI